MKPGDLVRISGACYDGIINQHKAAEAILHYVCLLPNGTLGVIMDIVPYGDAPVWCQVLTSGQTVWVNGSGVRAV